MKLMIASDIHGSAFYCEKLLERFAAERPEKLLLLGDLLYHGPRNALPEGYDPGRVSELLGGIAGQILCVRGNCEAEVDQLMFPFPVMAEYCILSLGGRTVFATHGHHFNEETVPPHSAGDILINGHFHVPACREHEDYLYVNPGSVSIPKDGSPHSYMVFENGAFLWKDLDGNVFMEKTL